MYECHENRKSYDLKQKGSSFFETTTRLHWRTNKPSSSSVPVNTHNLNLNSPSWWICSPYILRQFESIFNHQHESSTRLNSKQQEKQLYKRLKDLLESKTFKTHDESSFWIASPTPDEVLTSLIGKNTPDQNAISELSMAVKGKNNYNSSYSYNSSSTMWLQLHIEDLFTPLSSNCSQFLLEVSKPFFLAIFPGIGPEVSATLLTKALNEVIQSVTSHVTVIRFRSMELKLSENIAGNLEVLLDVSFFLVFIFILFFPPPSY